MDSYDVIAGLVTRTRAEQLARIRRRGERLRRRRAVCRGTGAGVASVAIVVVVLQVVGGTSSQGLRVGPPAAGVDGVGPGGVTTTGPPPHGDPAEGSEGAQHTRPEPGVEPPAPRAVAGAPDAGPTRRLPTAAATTSTTTPPTAADGCTAQGYEQIGVNTGGRNGLGASGYPTCTYTAVAAGGYIGKGKWHIEIQRGDSRIVAHHESDPSCRPTGWIQPGDHVTAQMWAGRETQDDPGWIRVGRDHHC